MLEPLFCRGRRALIGAIFLVGILAVLLPNPAQAASVRFDCFLPTGEIQCADVELAFFERMSFFKRATGDSGVDFVLMIREERGTEATIYTAARLKPDQAEAEGYLRRRTVRDSQNTASRFDQVLSVLQEVMIPELVIVSPGKVNDRGIFEAGMRAADGTRGKAATAWYFNPTASVSLTSSSFENNNVSLGGITNYSDEQMRFQAGAHFNWWKLVIPRGPSAPPDRGEVTSYDAGVAYGYSLKGGWAVGALAKAGHSPQENLEMATKVQAGLEWSLHPFMKHNEQNITVRYMVGHHHHEYVLENVEGKMASDHLSHSLMVYFVWHFEKVDLTLSGTASSLMRDIDYSSAMGVASATVRLTQSLYIAPTLVYVRNWKIINAPANPGEINAAQRYVGGSGLAETYRYMGLALKYFFGTPRPDDQRWNVLEEQH